MGLLISASVDWKITQGQRKQPLLSVDRPVLHAPVNHAGPAQLSANRSVWGVPLDQVGHDRAVYNHDT